MTKVEYDGDNPLRLGNEIEAALAKYGSGSDHRMCKAIHFFEGDLRLIAECLRCAGPPKVATQPPVRAGGTRRDSPSVVPTPETDPRKKPRRSEALVSSCFRRGVSRQ